MGPEESMLIQSNLGSTIAMAFDECVENPATFQYAKDSCARTYRWLVRCQKKMQELNASGKAVNPHQLLFGINQGCTFDDLRIEHMKQIADLDLDGYAIGGLAVGEPKEEMYRIITAIEPYMPKDKIRYLMGVGTPDYLIEGSCRGVDMFDCVLPTRMGRHGTILTDYGKKIIRDKKFAEDFGPMDPDCSCYACTNFSAAYVRHLIKANEMFGLRLCTYHNIHFLLVLMERIRQAIAEDRLGDFRKEFYERLG